MASSHEQPEREKRHDELAAGSTEMSSPSLPMQVEETSSRPLTVMLNHSYWCAMLTVLCLRSKTKFAAYLKSSFQCRLPPGKLPALFPIPIPSQDPFGMKLDVLPSTAF